MTENLDGEEIIGIGGHTQTSDQNEGIHGYIGMIRVFDRALTYKEVTESYKMWLERFEDI